MEAENEEEKKTEQKVRCIYAKMQIMNSRFYRVYPPKNNPTQFLDQMVTALSHKRKKPNQKLVHMKFLKDNKTVILGYDKASQRGDINFIDTAQPKISDFYYNKLNGGLGGIACFEDGRFILVTDKKGVFTYVDMSKGPNIEDIRNSSVQTVLDGVLAISLSPSQTKLACGISNNKCLIVDIGRDKSKAVVSGAVKKFEGHVYGVTSINWHPFRSLILSSSVDLNDNVKLWDPRSETLIHETHYHKNSAVSECLFHPQGNSYFSLGKDNVILEYEIRYTGILNTFRLDHQPTAMEVMNNGNLAVGDANGNLSWFDSYGQFLASQPGASGVVMMTLDSSKTILMVAREREHSFEMYTHIGALGISPIE